QLRMATREVASCKRRRDYDRDGGHGFPRPPRRIVEPLDFRPNLRSPLVAPVPICFHTSRYDSPHSWWTPRLGRSAGREANTGGHLVQHHPERVDVCSCIQRPALHLLGRHITYCPHGHTGVGQGLGLLRRAVKLGQTEIEKFGVTLLRDEDVRGLDIPVNDPGAMRGIQRIRYLRTERQHSGGWQWALCEMLPEVCPLQILHGQKW